MAVLKGKTGKTLISVITALAVLAVGVPLVSAYEAHTINVTVHVGERFNLVKTMRLATAEEIAASEIVFPSTPNPPSVTDPANVPTDTCVVWVVTIAISNPHDYCMTDVVVTDHFGAELAGEPIGEVPVEVFVKEHSRGQSKKEKITKEFETQYRVTWYVTCLDDPPEPEECVENGGCLDPGQSAYIEMYVWTKLNPAGNQEYTSPGEYTMNSGPTSKWFDPDGHQFSYDGEPLYITAY